MTVNLAKATDSMTTGPDMAVVYPLGDWDLDPYADRYRGRLEMLHASVWRQTVRRLAVELGTTQLNAIHLRHNNLPGLYMCFRQNRR